jgi:hypothetical protein
VNPGARGIANLLVRSCLAGLLLGAAARLIMRFVALEAGMSSGFSAGGSLEVVAFGAILGTPAALAFYLVRPRMAAVRPWPGPLYGAALYGVLAAVPPPAAQSALAATSDTPAATAAAFGTLFVAWGLALELLAAPKRRTAR